jgi:hypothetical protein
MRPIPLIAIGIVMFALFLIAGQIYANDVIVSTSFAIRTFVGLWLFAALANLWLGLTQSGPGHSFKEEFPRFVAVLSVPMAVALVFPWQM